MICEGGARRGIVSDLPACMEGPLGQRQGDGMYMSWSEVAE